MTGVELVLDSRAALAEGPAWDQKSQTLIWVDIPKGTIHRFAPAEGTDVFCDAGQAVGAAVPDSEGGLVYAAANGFWRMSDMRASPGTLLTPVEEDRPNMRMNDGKCDTRGRFWAGTLDLGFASGLGSLYRLDQNNSVHRMLTGLTVSNGMGWSPDDRRMYLIDTFTYGVDVFDFDVNEGVLHNRKRLIDIAKKTGEADGMAVDADGCIWIAIYGGGMVHRYTPAGILDVVVKLPASQVTSCAFGGNDYKDLYITTANQDSDPSQLYAGGIFAIRTSVCGLPTNLYNVQ